MTLMVTHRVYDGNHLVNELTIAVDKFLNEKRTTGFFTYLYPFNQNTYAIRFPGATRGHVKVTSIGVITEVKIYDTKLYNPNVNDYVKKFIGRRIMLKEELINDK